jgi:hypothetical protein
MAEPFTIVQLVYVLMEISDRYLYRRNVLIHDYTKE